LKDLGKTSQVQAEQIMPAQEEDDFAQDTIDSQNIAAILCAAVDYERV